MPKFAYFLYRFFTFSTQFYLKTDAYLVLSDQFTFSLFFFLKAYFGVREMAQWVWSPCFASMGT